MTTADSPPATSPAQTRSPANLSPAQLALVAHVERIGPLLADLLPGRSNVKRSTLVDHKAGRALFRVDVVVGPERAEHQVIAKIFSDLTQAARVHQTMNHLWSEVFAATPGLTIPQPLGWIPDLGLVAYRRVDGQPLHQIGSPTALSQWTRAAARWLTVLHRSSITLDRQLSVVHEANNAIEWAAVTDRQLGRNSTCVSSVAAALSPVAAQLRIATDTPIHKDFHYEHVIVDRGVAVIDLDETRAGDPTFDLAHFCTNLRLLSLRGLLSDIEQTTLAHDFLDEYQTSTDWRQDERFAFFSALTGVKLAKQIATGRGPGPRPSGTERIRQASLIAAEAMAWLK